MPPKKKGKGKKGMGKKKKTKDDGALDLADMYRKTVDEIEALKDHLALRRELTRHSRASATEKQDEVIRVESRMEEEKKSYKDVIDEMERQYKVMQADYMQQIHVLEKELLEKSSALRTTQVELKQAREENERSNIEKDLTIQNLQFRIMSMEKSYEGILREALDSIVEKINKSRGKWETKSTVIQESNKKQLMEFELQPHGIKSGP